jgi:hypothetical protein
MKLNTSRHAAQKRLKLKETFGPIHALKKRLLLTLPMPVVSHAPVVIQKLL